MIADPTVRQLERLANAGWPALEHVVRRVATALRWWVHPAVELRPADRPRNATTRGEARPLRAGLPARGLPLTVKITSATDPEIDDELGRRAMPAEARSSVWRCDLKASRAVQQGDDEGGVVIHSAPTAQWTDDYVRLNSVPADRRAALDALHARFPHPVRTATLAQGGRAACVALAVLQADHVGVFDVVTDASHRRQGMATRVVTALLASSRAADARTAYLQVAHDNAPAIGLYRRLGFQEVYQYWYRSTRAP